MTYYDIPENLTVLGSYTTLNDLTTAHPTGVYGQVYVVAGEYYTWSRDSLSWVKLPSQAVENRLVNLALSKVPQPHITGLKLKADVALGDLVLNTIDDAGVVWVVTDIDGWWRLPEVETQDLARGWGDGSYDAKGRYANRLITLTGSFLTQTADQAAAARDRLFRAIDLVYKGGWLIVRESPDKYAWVRLSGTPEVQNVSARGRTDFSIGLKAVDPIKYELVGNDVNSLNDEVIAMNGSVTVTNIGNTPVPVMFEVSGALTASPASPASIKLTSAEPDKVINIVVSQSAGNQLEIDTYKREVLYNGQGYETGVGAARRRVSTIVDWFELQPGANTISFTGTGQATCTVLFRSGWIG
jgi:phage-related protein